MLVQYILIGVIVGGAMLYLLRRLWRSLGSGGGKGGGCGCGCGDAGGRGADRLGKRRELIELRTPPQRDGD